MDFHTVGFENISSLSRTHVARSTEQHLARLFSLICKKLQNMSCAFSGTVSQCCLFSHFRPFIAGYKTWSISCSNWQFLFIGLLMVSGTGTQKSCQWNPSGRQLLTIFQGVSVWAAWGALFNSSESSSLCFHCMPRNRLKGAPQATGNFTIDYLLCLEYRVPNIYIFT